jgi:hypothetical protein
MADSNDSLQRFDPTSQELAYNNVTDRMKVELPGGGDPKLETLTKKRFYYNANQDVSVIKEALAAAASGAVCMVQTFSYNANNDVDYIVETLGTW